jgi:hypothetical protein
MGKPDAPTPPNPIQTAGLATGTNVSTAIANAFLNNTNQVTPTGSLDYNQSGSYSWTDPTTGSTYQVPRFTATQTLTPMGQAIQGQDLAAQYNLAGMANAQSGKVANLLSTPFSPGTSAPAAGDASAISGIPAAQTSFNAGGPIQSSLNLTGAADPNNIAQSYGTDPSFSTAAVQQALMGQLQPQLDLQKQQLQQQLADQGIRYGSDAYNNAMMPFNQQENNAWMQAITGATGQQAQQMQMAGARAAFQNTAQQQAYDQLVGAGTFVNQAQSQQFQQGAAQGTFANAGLAQQLQQQQAAFNAQQAQRASYMQEQYAQRNQPINEITSLLSGSQVSQPNFVNTPGSQIPTTDVAGLINNNFSQQMSAYQQQSQNYNSLMGGILGLGAGALKASDRRMKRDIDKIATVFAADADDAPKKLPIYSYSYKDDPVAARHIGPMAQDVEKITPDAVRTIGGRKYIKPDHVMGSILRAA